MYVNVAVLKETQKRDRRVALVSSVAAKLVKLGAKLHLQSGAGDAIKLTDAAFKNVAFTDDRNELVSDGDVVLAVQPPALEVISAMKEDAILISFIGATIAALFVATMISLPTAFAQLMPPGNEQHSMPGMDSPQKVGLAREIAQLRSRIAQIQAALDQNHQGGSFKARVQPVGMAMDDKMRMSGAANKPAMNSKGMPTAAGCCSGMMGKMGVAGSASTTMPSDLPGFPGASHLYHIGATGFFLDHPQHIALTTEQQAALSRAKEQALLAKSTADRAIQQAEQELWTLTAADQPDAVKIKTKIGEIEKLKGDQRIAFIRSVGEAARVLTDEQRAALLGTGAPQAAQMTAPQGSAGAVNPQGGMGSTDPKAGMAGMGDDSMGNMGGGKTPTTTGNGGKGDM